MGCVYVAAGVIAWLTRPSNRRGWLVTAGGLAWIVSGFVNVPQKALIAGGLITGTLGRGAVSATRSSMSAKWRIRGIRGDPQDPQRAGGTQGGPALLTACLGG
jgi:hypothetical protein